jgi:hypothetical protein
MLKNTKYECSTNCGEKLTAQSILYSCNFCQINNCSTECLIKHIQTDHTKKIEEKKKCSSYINSQFKKEGIMLNETKTNSYFEYKNFEKVYTDSSKQRQHILGSGAFGQVFLAKNKQDGVLVAIKHIDKERLFKMGIKRDLIIREINIQMRLIHPNIARMFSYYEDNKSYYLIMEYIDKGTLFQIIQKSRGFKEEKAFELFIQVVNAFNFLHEYNLIHRDLKPENCLIDKNDTVKLCDFGWTVELKEQDTRDTFCGTYEYMAPEIVKHIPYDESIDVWSLGVLLYELIHSYSPFRVIYNF